MSSITFDEPAARASLRRLTPFDRERMREQYVRLEGDAAEDERRRGHARRVLQLLEAVQREAGHS